MKQSFLKEWTGRWVKGEASTLYADSRQDRHNMRAASFGEKDVRESVHLKINEDNFDHVKEIIQERNGEISVIKL